MRNLFGAGIADWTFLTDVDGTVHLASAEVTFYNAQSGGTQYTDLSLDLAGTEPVTSITSSDGSGGQRLGTIATEFYGPDGVTEMWAQAGDLPRVKMTTTDAAKIAAAQAGDIDDLQNKQANTDLLAAYALYQITGDDDGLLPDGRPDILVGKRVLFINDTAPAAGISTKNDVWIGRPL